MAMASFAPSSIQTRRPMSWVALLLARIELSPCRLRRLADGGTTVWGIAVSILDRFRSRSKAAQGLPVKGEPTAADFAAGLFRRFVEDESAGTKPETYHVPPASSPLFRAKMRLYREGALLLTLVQAQSGELQKKVLREYEHLFLPSSPTPEGLQGMENLKVAMKDIGRLIDPAGERKPPSWAAEWFKQIGHDDGLNPVDLQLFSLWWMDYCILASDAVNGRAQRSAR